MGMTIEQLEAALLAVTDKVGGLIDQVQQKGFVPVFICGHSGLYYPADYVKEWGRKFGIGLGPDPVSEILDTDYYTAPPAITPDIRSLEQIMHPFGVTQAQVDFDMVSPVGIESKMAVVDQADWGYKKRVRILHKNQMKNPASRLPSMYASWDKVKGTY